MKILNSKWKSMGSNCLGYFSIKVRGSFPCLLVGCLTINLFAKSTSCDGCYLFRFVQQLSFFGMDSSPKSPKALKFNVFLWTYIYCLESCNNSMSYYTNTTFPSIQVPPSLSSYFFCNLFVLSTAPSRKKVLQASAVNESLNFFATLQVPSLPSFF